ncbi:MAG TPA: hypothetical protein VGL61_07915 [Kofleriaceae bacterium]
MTRMGWVLPFVVFGCVDQQQQPAAPAELPSQTFAADVVPILVEKCSANSGGCHAATGDQFGLDFMNYDVVAGTPELNDLTTSWLVFLPPQHAGGKNILNAADQQVIVDWLYSLHGETPPN